MIRSYSVTIIVIIFFATFYLSSSISQNQTTPNLDLNSNISETAYSLTNYHFKLYQEEKTKGNESGANYHWNLGMMSIKELSDLLSGSLNAEDKKEIIEQGPGNCLITKDIAVKCSNK
jgi:hypothetical protein